ncbi:FKBP-type peptidyl-prolyl cis-trans isomerase [Candidatus Gracilibacteria bacterium]|nr:FKBP-type peptidyl-prolyl cis-trans isomerase [Candidatus Gracilibacteria bacterium]MCF7819224.1 FKBP-type peptidyl-prolyl cis-trans isomerase [Candidatus Gracilibacteria bacterium]
MKKTFFSAFVLFLLPIFTGCQKAQAPQPSSSEKNQEQQESETNTSPATLQIEVLREGTGAPAQKGDFVVVHYEGTFEDGTKFDSSRDRGAPFPFTVGGGQVITGWDQGVEGMKVGEVRRLIIPPHLAYGEDGIGPIPPDSTLIFEVELLEIKSLEDIIKGATGQKTEE